MKNTIGQDFTLYTLLKFAFPTIIMMIITSLYTIVDSMFVSHFIGTNALSAINIVYPFISLIMALAIMLASGGSAIIARKLGSGDIQAARSNLSLLYITGIIIAVILSLTGFFYLTPIVKFLGASPLLFDYAADYLSIFLFFAPVLVLQMLCQTFLITAGNPRLGLISSIAAGLVNIALDYVFIVELDMGISGAALATGIGYCIGATCGLAYLAANRSSILYFGRPELDFKVIGHSVFNGSSEMITNIAMAVITFLYNLIMMKHLGENGVAAITIILYVEFLLNALFLGFSMGVEPIFSYNYGAKNKQQIQRIFKSCTICIGVGTLIVFTLAALFFPHIVSVFTPIGSEVYNIAADGFPIFSLCFLFGGINIFTTALFTAFSNGKISGAISFLRTFVFISGGLLILPHIFAIPGIWMAMPIAELVTLSIALYFLYMYRRRYHLL